MQLTTRRARGYDVRTRSRIAGLGQDADFVGPPPELNPAWPGPIETVTDYSKFFTGESAPVPAQPSFFEQAGSFLRNIVQPVAQTTAQVLATRKTVGRSGLPVSYSATGQPIFPGMPGQVPASQAQPNWLMILGVGATVLLVATAVMQRRK